MFNCIIHPPALLFFACRYKEDTKLTAILYLHRITDNRMSGTPNRNLQMFGKLTGDKAARNVVFVTTAWDRLSKHEIGEKREGELKGTFWDVMLKYGATTARFNNSKDAAWKIIDDVVARNTEGVTLLIQEELVELRLRLKETAAGQALYVKLNILVDQQKDTVEKLFEQIQLQSDPARKKTLLEEYLKIQNDLQKTMEEANQLHVTFLQKLGRLFSWKKAKAVCLICFHIRSFEYLFSYFSACCEHGLIPPTHFSYPLCGLSICISFAHSMNVLLDLYTYTDSVCSDDASRWRQDHRICLYYIAHTKQ